MDPVSHAASGVVALLALEHRPAHRLALPLAALAAASPDVDILFASGPLQFLLLHRGITHSLAALPLLGLLLALASRPLWRADTPGHWSFTKVWLFMCFALGLHIWLDVVTTYGTMIFLPFSHQRVRMNGLFIVDPLFTLPLLGAAVYAARKTCRKAAIAALIWVFFWPGLGVTLAGLHTANLTERLAAQGRNVTGLVVLPDALAPFFWRALYAERPTDGGPVVVREQALDVIGLERATAQSYSGLPQPLARDLARVSSACSHFLDFSILPVLAPLPQKDIPPASDSGVIFKLVYDLRFGSSHAWVRRLMGMRPNADIPFQLMLELERDGRAASGLALVRERLRFSDSGRDSGWIEPQRPRKPDLLTWLAGLR
ncbi:MAG: metal-dependent hydrolase [Desulfovibrio sp.]|jgi:inner membrane protein|nr:metal-dependent hydrolase [Desulfovibrio sp.]